MSLNHKAKKSLVQQGFSTIEFIISLLIIWLVLVVTVPSYLSKLKHARFSIVIEAAQSMQDPITACAQFMGSVEKCNGDTSSAGRVAALSIKHGVINAVGNVYAGEYNYQLTPHYDAKKDFMTWTVSGTCLAAGLCSQ